MKTPESANPVTLYVVPPCPLCSDAREWLDAKGIQYQVRDVANDFGALRRMYKLTRQNLVPVLEKNGKALVRPSDDEMSTLLSAE